MKRFTLAVTLCLTPCLIYSLSRAQDKPVWKYIGSAELGKTGEKVAYRARDCYRHIDAESAKYPKLAVRMTPINKRNLKETVEEYDCKRRVFRTRIVILTDGAEVKITDFYWREVAPGSIEESLLNYTCRDRSKEKK
jgi:hypothetical protein